MVHIIEIDGDQEFDYSDHIVIGEEYKTDHFTTEAVAINAYKIVAGLGLSTAGEPVITRRRNNISSTSTDQPVTNTQPVTSNSPDMTRFAAEATF